MNYSTFKFVGVSLQRTKATLKSKNYHYRKQKYNLRVNESLFCTMLDSYRFITIYKSIYEFICLESHVNTEINLDLRVSNIPGYSAAEG